MNNWSLFLALVFLSVDSGAVGRDYTVRSWNEVVEIAERGESNVRIFMDFERDACFPALVLTNVKNWVLSGRGAGSTEVHVARSTKDCILFSDNVSDVEITGFSLLGDIGKDQASNNGNAAWEHADANQPGPNTPGPGCDVLVHRGISTSAWKCNLNASDESVYSKNIADIYIHEMEIAYLTTAISLQGTQDSQIRGVDVRRNKIHHIRGTKPGVGYGVHTSWTPELLVYQNEFFRVGRHSIYIGLGGLSEDDRIRVERNSVRDGGSDHPDLIKSVCVAIARTAYVSVFQNEISRCYAHALSVELDERGVGDPIIVRGIELTDNVISNTPEGRLDVWINLSRAEPHGAIRAHGNRKPNGAPAVFSSGAGTFVDFKK